jgi:hypothetical protein
MILSQTIACAGDQGVWACACSTLRVAPEGRRRRVVRLQPDANQGEERRRKGASWGRLRGSQTTGSTLPCERDIATAKSQASFARLRGLAIPARIGNPPYKEKAADAHRAAAAWCAVMDRYSSVFSSSSRPSRCALRRSSRRLARSAARLTSSEPTSSIMACSAPSPLRGPRRTMRV